MKTPSILFSDKEIQLIMQLLLVDPAHEAQEVYILTLVILVLANRKPPPCFLNTFFTGFVIVRHRNRLHLGIESDCL